MAEFQRHKTHVNRYYIDTRPLLPPPSKTPAIKTPSIPLPLLSTLQFAEQESITRFLRPADRYMSLASALLKYYFIHTRARIPWADVHISRTPAPHRRPFWKAPEDWDAQRGGLEFNVSHQAGLIALVGCDTPPAPTTGTNSAPADAQSHHAGPEQLPADAVRLGVDISCCNEDKRTPRDMATQAKFDEWVDIFAEMFSERERRDMRFAPVHVPVDEVDEADAWGSDSSSGSEKRGGSAQERQAQIIQLKLRRFYAYWGLKEAYIKMVGEGLLASWLRELEFSDVVPPPTPLPPRSRRASNSHSRSRSREEWSGIASPVSAGGGANQAAAAASLLSPVGPSPVDLAGLSLNDMQKWTEPARAEKRVKTTLRGELVEGVDIEMVAFEEDFLVATAFTGVHEVGPETAAEAEGLGFKRWIRLDIDKIKLCAEGKCSCLD